MDTEDDEAIVRRVLARLTAVTGYSGSYADLESAARLGIVEARTRFDPTRGVKFSTFAYYRARGAAYDYLRRSSYVSRRAYEAIRAEEAVDRVGEAAGEQRAGEAAQRTTVEGALAAVDDAVQQITASLILSCVGQESQVEERTSEAILVESETRALLLAAVRSLGDRERALLEGHYFDGRDFDEVAAELGISKSWASRLHTKALDTLRKRLARLSR